MPNLDDLDVKILRELHTNPPHWNERKSFSDVARALGVDEETVRRRVKRAGEQGFLPRWKMLVNPRLVGCEAAHLYVDVGVEEESRKIKAISQLKLVDGLVYIIDFQGRALRTLLYYEDDASMGRKLELIRSICGSPQIAMWDSRFPRPDVRMKKIDWKILDGMKEDARKDLKDVAASLGVSGRTVQRRFSTMSREGGAMYLVGPPSVERVGGLVCNFLVFCPDERKKRIVDTTILSMLGRIGSTDTSGDRYSIFGVACENHSEAEKMTARLQALDGVGHVRMDVMKEFIVIQDWLFGEVRRRIATDRSS